MSTREPPSRPADPCGSEPELMPAAEALARIEAAARPLGGCEEVALGEALGRCLAATVHAPADVPGHRNSAVDGFALRGAELPERGERRFRVLGTAFAGAPFAGEVTPGSTVRVMTGAVMPAGADTVVMQEEVRLEGDSALIGPGHRVGQNVREAGEDLRRGAPVLADGHRIGPAELGLLASLGMATVRVHRRVRVAFFSTGDEIRSLGEPLAAGEIYDSNRYTLHGMLARLGCERLDMGVVRDDPAAFRAAFAEAAAMADVVITSGGASTGEADYVAETLAALGQIGLWRIAIRPGKPLAFGRVGEALYFGLPGNPVAVMVTFYQFCQPALRRLAGERDPRPTPPLEATCTVALRKRRGRTEYYRAVLERDAEGRLTVRSTGRPGSALLHTMSDANCFIVLPAERGPVEPGERVEVQPFFGLM